MLIKIDGWKQLTAVVKLLYSKEANSKHCDRFMPDFIHDELCFGYSGANVELEELLCEGDRLRDKYGDKPVPKAVAGRLNAKALDLLQFVRLPVYLVWDDDGWQFYTADEVFDTSTPALVKLLKRRLDDD